MRVVLQLSNAVVDGVQRLCSVFGTCRCFLLAARSSGGLGDELLTEILWILEAFAFWEGHADPKYVSGPVNSLKLAGCVYVPHCVLAAASWWMREWLAA